MIYAYKMVNGLIQPLGQSDEQERLIKALQMANINTDGILFTDVEPVQIKGKYFLSADDAEYQRLKAEEEAEQERLANLSTAEERIEAQVMYTALLTDTLLEG